MSPHIAPFAAVFPWETLTGRKQVAVLIVQDDLVLSTTQFAHDALLLLVKCSSQEASSPLVDEAVLH